MANFVPLYNQGFGARLGQQLGGVLSSIGEGLGQGVNYNTEQILRDLAQKKAEGMRVQALQQFMPFASQQELAALSSFPESIQFQALQGGFGQQAPLSGVDALKQQPFSQEQLAALKAIPEAQRNQILQRLQGQPAVQQAQQRQQPISLGRALRAEQADGKAGAGPKLSKADEKFDTKVVSDAQTATEILSILDDIDAILDRNNFSSGFIADLAPNSLKGYLGEDTQTLNNLFNALVVKQSVAEGQGRGSDLLRKMVSEGKLSLGQTPDVMKIVAKRLREEQENKVALAEARDQFFDQFGYAPRAEQTKQLAAKRQQEARKQLKEPKSGFKLGSLIDELPGAAPIGAIVRDTETGKLLQYTGDKNNPWIEV